MIKLIVALVLLGHGIGHSMGMLQVFKVATVNPQWQGDSWLLSNTVGATATQLIGIGLWTLAMVGFTVLAAVVIGWLPEAWFAPLAVGSALASLAGLALFPTAFPTFSSIGAFAVNAAVLAAALWFHWVPSDLTA